MLQASELRIGNRITDAYYDSFKAVIIVNSPASNPKFISFDNAKRVDN